MASPEEVIKPPREMGSREKRVTVMIMRNLGSVRSFKISPVLLAWSLLFFVAFAVVSVFAINGYLSLRRLTAEQKRKLNVLTEKSGAALIELQKTEQRIAILRDYIRDIEKPRKEAPEAATKEKPVPPPAKKREPAPEKEPAPKIAAPPAEKTEPAPPAPQPAPQEPPLQTEEKAEVLVDIRDLEIQKEETRLTLNFRLVNLDSGENAVGGYVHAIAKIEESDPPQSVSYPVEKLKEGIPVNYRRGQPFLIQRFKPMKARFDLSNTTHPPSSILFLVYDQSGKLMLDKAFEVKDDS